MIVTMWIELEASETLPRIELTTLNPLLIVRGKLYGMNWSSQMFHFKHGMWARSGYFIGQVGSTTKQIHFYCFLVPGHKAGFETNPFLIICSGSKSSQALTLAVRALGRNSTHRYRWLVYDTCIYMLENLYWIHVNQIRQIWNRDWT